MERTAPKEQVVKVQSTMELPEFPHGECGGMVESKSRQGLVICRRASHAPLVTISAGLMQHKARGIAWGRGAALSNGPLAWAWRPPTVRRATLRFHTPSEAKEAEVFGLFPHDPTTGA